MDKTAISTKLLPSVSANGETGLATALPAVKPAPKPLTVGRIAYKCLGVVASLKLTVLLLALSIPLVFFGTLAQVDAGIWTVVEKYFRNKAFVWVPFQIFVPRSIPVSGGFPYPGGWLIGMVMLVNLLAAHAVRFKISWKRSGILLIHTGILVIMVSEGITGKYAVEAHMMIEQGKDSNYLQHSEPELAILKSLGKSAGQEQEQDEVTVIPERLLKGKGLIQHELLPFDVEVVQYMINSTKLFEVEPGDTKNPATAGIGARVKAEPLPEVSGTDPEQKQDMPAAYVTFKRKDNGQVIGTYLVSFRMGLNQKVAVNDGKQDQVYEISLRPKRSYKSYTLHLTKFVHEKHVGNGAPKNFASHVRLVDEEHGENRDVVISMNRPLDYRGETFYQASFLPDDSGTVLQVVRNPGWMLPYLSCLLVGVGMLVHFGLKLVGFVQKRVVL